VTTGPDEVSRQPEESPDHEGARSRTPVDLEDGELLLWKMASVKGFFHPRVLKGYLVTNKRCFVWDASEDRVLASIGLREKFQVTAKDVRQVKAPRRGGGRFMSADGPTVHRPGEIVLRGDLRFVQDGREVMCFPGVVDPDAVVALIQGLGQPSED
jgi:hypothetical protein